MPIRLLLSFLLFSPFMVWAQDTKLSFRPVTTDEREAVSQLTEDNVVSLRVSTFGRSYNEAFLFGVFNLGSGPFRSVLLRTTNGGQSWGEVMKPVGFSEVSEIQFVSVKRGFALVYYTMEGPGPVEIFYTSDGGATWKSRGEVPKSEHSDMPTQMHFSSSQKGEVYMICNVSAKDRHMMRFTTTNGGKTWRKGPCKLESTFTLPQPANPLPKDLTMWEAEDSQFLPYIEVLRYRANEQQKTTVAKIPYRWKVVGNRLQPIMNQN